MINNFFYSWDHNFIYDRATLEHALVIAGFGDVVERDVGASNDPHLRGLELHGDVIGDEYNRFETLVLEARCGAAAD